MQLKCVDLGIAVSTGTGRFIGWSRLLDNGADAARSSGACGVFVSPCSTGLSC